MAQMGDGYGSEAQLLRFLGRHRQQFDRLVLGAVGGDSVEWLDFRFDPKARWQDAEWTGIDFVEDTDVRDRWRAFWPTTGTPPNWDAVAHLRRGAGTEWLLIEAKANLEEIERSTGAGPDSRRKITDAFETVKADLGVDPERDWLTGYYQFCFQVAVLWFLVHNDVPARLLYVYFIGDRHPAATCPRSREEWWPALERMNDHVGLPKRHGLEDRIGHVFVPVVS